jgi:hypothetical protein
MYRLWISRDIALKLCHTFAELTTEYIDLKLKPCAVQVAMNAANHRTGR